jgi:serine/threonine-protein kinase RsbW
MRMTSGRRILRNPGTQAPPPLRFRREGRADLQEARECAAETGRRLRAWGLPPERVARWEVAVAEMATNVVRHGYPEGRSGRMVLDVCWDDEGLTISLLDEGVGFDPSLIHPPGEPDPHDPRTWPEGGMGLMLVRSAGDRLNYSSRGGQHVLSLFTQLPRS